MKINLIALVIFAVIPFSTPFDAFAQAAPDELLEEAPAGTSSETDDLLSEMDGTGSGESAPEAAPETEVTPGAVTGKPMVPAAAPSSAAFGKIDSLSVSDADLAAFMKSGGLRSRIVK